MKLNSGEELAEKTRRHVGNASPQAAVYMLGGKISYARLTDWEAYHIAKREDGFEIILDEKYARSTDNLAFWVARAIGDVMTAGYMSEQWETIPMGKEMRPRSDSCLFAYAFLMPANKVREYVNTHSEHGYISLEEMDEYFHVNGMSERRLKMLKLAVYKF